MTIFLSVLSCLFFTLFLDLPVPRLHCLSQRSNILFLLLLQWLPPLEFWNHCLNRLLFYCLWFVGVWDPDSFTYCCSVVWEICLHMCVCVSEKVSELALYLYCFPLFVMILLIKDRKSESDDKAIWWLSGSLNSASSFVLIVFWGDLKSF